MATVAKGRVGDGPAPLVSQSGNERGHQAGSSDVVEQAKLVLSARYGFLLDEAFAMLCALARSQRRSVEEFSDSVVRSSGRLDGDVRGNWGDSLLSSQNGRGTVSLSAELLIEVPSAVSAFLLAGSLADYGAHAVVEEGVRPRDASGRRNSSTSLLCLLRRYYLLGLGSPSLPPMSMFEAGAQLGVG